MPLQQRRAKLCGGFCFSIPGNFSIGRKDAAVTLSLLYLYLHQLYDSCTPHTSDIVSLYLSHQTQPRLPASVLADCDTQVPYRPRLYRHVTSRRVTGLKSICPLSSCSLLFYAMAGKSTEFNRIHILRDAHIFSSEEAHWVDY